MKIVPAFEEKIKENEGIFFATFNPGYGGRFTSIDELSKNMTSIAQMTVPPFEDIMTGMMISEGFT